MANYSVTKWVSSISDVAAVMAEMETQVEAVDDSKTIRLIGVLPVGSNICQGYLIYDA